MQQNGTYKTRIPRLMFVGTGSGCGKTTVTCALLKAFVERGLKVASFKCGPDYIDPMFHSKVIGTESRNLDVFLCGEAWVKHCLAKTAIGCDIAVAEGVMGMYDGLGMAEDAYSSNHIATITEMPQILTVDVKGMGFSVVALIHGFLSFRNNHIRGVIFNNCSEAMYPRYKEVVETALPIKAYGFLPRLEQASIESRHLGLLVADEVRGIHEKLALLAAAAERCMDMDGLIRLASEAAPLQNTDVLAQLPAKKQVTVAIARDNAFCFFYRDNLDILEALGANIVYFSPLADKGIPPYADGLLFYGGYPEEYAETLSQNASMLKSVRAAAKAGMPIIAECGGFMYLLETLRDRHGTCHAMCGILKGEAVMKQKCERFGYLCLEAQQDTLLCKKGEKIPAHEFHYSDTNNNGTAFTASKKQKSWQCIHAEDNLFVGYPHIHWGGNMHFAVNFMNACHQFKSNRECNNGFTGSNK